MSVACLELEPKTHVLFFKNHFMPRNKEKPLQNSMNLIKCINTH